MGVLEPTGRGRLVVAALIVVGAAGGLFAAWYRVAHSAGGPREGRRAVPGEAGGPRVVVEVLNTTSSVGLARIATRRLRDAGLDVVYLGTDTGASLDSTAVLVRRGPQAAGSRVARALGTGTVSAAADPGRLVDVTVRLGRDFVSLVGERREP